MSNFRSVFIGLLLLAWCQLVSAQLYNGRSLQTSNLDELVADVQPGSILILGENHGLSAHKDQHMQILTKLREAGLKTSVGLEFVNYTDQNFVDLYRQNLLTDDEFLSAITWKGYAFEFYKPQLKFPNIELGELSLGLNISRDITSKISKNGLDSLTEAEKSLMPPQFAVGRDSYKERFRLAVGGHCPNFENCFTAQSAWDDTMAWRAVNFIRAHPDQVLVIVVGEFHAQYGGGLADRILTRLPGAQIKTVSQIWTESMTPEEIQEALQASPIEGPRADYIWLSGPTAK